MAKNNDQTNLVKELSKEKIALKITLKALSGNKCDYTLESLKDEHNFDTKELIARIGQKNINKIIKILEG